MLQSRQNAVCRPRRSRATQATFPQWALGWRFDLGVWLPSVLRRRTPLAHRAAFEDTDLRLPHQRRPLCLHHQKGRQRGDDARPCPGLRLEPSWLRDCQALRGLCRHRIWRLRRRLPQVDAETLPATPAVRQVRSCDFEFNVCIVSLSPCLGEAAWVFELPHVFV